MQMITFKITSSIMPIVATTWIRKCNITNTILYKEHRSWSNKSGQRKGCYSSQSVNCKITHSICHQMHSECHAPSILDIHSVHSSYYQHDTLRRKMIILIWFLRTHSYYPSIRWDDPSSIRPSIFPNEVFPQRLVGQTPFIRFRRFIIQCVVNWKWNLW